MSGQNLNNNNRGVPPPPGAATLEDMVRQQNRHQLNRNAARDAVPALRGAADYGPLDEAHMLVASPPPAPHQPQLPVPHAEAEDPTDLELLDEDEGIEDKENAVGDVEMLPLVDQRGARVMDPTQRGRREVPFPPRMGAHVVADIPPLGGDTTMETATVPSARMDVDSPADPSADTMINPQSNRPRDVEMQEAGGEGGTGAEEEEEDRYKPEGHVELHIDRFSEFARPGSSPEQAQRLSAPVHIRGLPWKILAIPRDQPPNRQQMDRRMSSHAPKALGFFLQCNGDAVDSTWTCTANAVLRILSQKPGVDDNVRKINHTFYAKENDWGYSQFILCDALLDAAAGYIKDDTVVLTVDVSADAPHGVHWDSKKHAGHIGLKNQGATCYMNSILQTLFFTNKLRRAVYQMPTEEDDTESSVALAMQRVFYELQFSTLPVGTKKLTKSFGWDSVDSFLQHDVQELCRVLLDNLESKMKSTVVAETIPLLFRGRMKSYIKCKNIDVESSRVESYYDVQLNVKGKANIMESFRDYTEPEILDGDNKYDAGDHGLQAAEKGVKFLSFPPVLHLQLMRFQYDPALDANVKVNDRFEFPDTLVLNEFVDESAAPESEDFTYLLHAVLVHSGDFHGGHYVVFINTNLKGNHKWCKFDDDVVSRAAYRDAVTANYGGDDPELNCKSYTNAYMLVYVKKSALNDVLCAVGETDIPEHLRKRFELEKQRDIQRKREKDEERMYCEITLITDEQMKAHNGLELFDPKAMESQCRKLKVEKTMSVRDLYHFVAKNMNLQLEPPSFRLWEFADAERYKTHELRFHHSEALRPRKHLPYRPLAAAAEEQQELEHNGSGDHLNDGGDGLVESDRTIYLELGRYNKATARVELKPYDDQHDLLFFLKYFNHERQVSEYRGTVYLHADADLKSQEPEICAHLGLPADTHLNLYVEFRPDALSPCRGMTKSLLHERLLANDGGIFWAEMADKVTAEKNAAVYFRNLCNRVEVEAFLHMDGLGSPPLSPVLPVKGFIGLDWPLSQVVQWVGEEAGLDDTRLLLWKTTHNNEKPVQMMHYNEQQAWALRELLNLTPSNMYDPRAGRCFKLFYSLLPVRVAELEYRKPAKIQVLHDKFQLGELVVFPDKNGTVESLLKETAQYFKFAEDGTRQLRLVHVGLGATCMRVFQVFARDSPLADLWNRFTQPPQSLRIEEVPRDQLEIGANEHLLPVAHYDKEPSRMHGVPFFLKIANDERFSNIRRRIKELLEVPDREFEKYKFAIIAGNRVVRELDADENAVVNLAELTHTHTTSPNLAAFLAVNHLNKSRGMRGGHTTEKAIVIHN